MFSTVTGRNCFLHLFQHIKKSVQVLNFRISNSFISIPTKIWSKSRFQRFTCLCRRTLRNFRWNRIDSFCSSKLVNCFDRRIILMNVLGICQKIRHVHYQTCCYQILKTSSIRIRQDQISQISSCRTGLEERITAARYIWSNNIQFHIEFIFYHFCKPSGLKSLIVCLPCKHIYSNKIAVGSVTVCSTGRCR